MVKYTVIQTLEATTPSTIRRRKMSNLPLEIHTPKLVNVSFDEAVAYYKKNKHLEGQHPDGFFRIYTIELVTESLGLDDE